MQIKCPVCNSKIEFGDTAKTAICPGCKTKLYNNKTSDSFIRIDKKLVRKEPKIKMSKKQRLKERNLLVR
jgi:hypothetical protein